jgi:L-lactate dehydrogenase complex protein LldG
VIDGGLRAHFVRKATAAGASVSNVPVASVEVARASHRGDGDHVAEALFAVAETGSVAVAWPRDERGAALLAERLFLFVGADTIVATLDEALARIEALVRDGRPYVTLMTGPSRTADIERALTVGVHGPRELHVLLVA